MNILIHQKPYKISWYEEAGESTGGEEKEANPLEALSSFANISPEKIISTLGMGVIGALIATIFSSDWKITAGLAGLGAGAGFLGSEQISKWIPGLTNFAKGVEGNANAGAEGIIAPDPPIDDSPKFDSPIDKFPITSGFGMRWGRMHQGLDFGTPPGSDIKAPKNSRVVYAGLQTGKSDTGWGYHVILEHKNSKGEYTYTLYGHLDGTDPVFGLDTKKDSKIKAGTILNKGQVFAKTGGDGRLGSGRTTGPHLHYEVISVNGGKRAASREAIIGGVRTNPATCTLIH